MTVNPEPPPVTPSPGSRPPLFSFEALVIMLIVGLAVAAAIVWPSAAIGITVGVAVLAVLIVATQAR